GDRGSYRRQRSARNSAGPRSAQFLGASVLDGGDRLVSRLSDHHRRLLLPEEPGGQRRQRRQSALTLARFVERDRGRNRDVKAFHRRRDWNPRALLANLSDAGPQALA